MTQEQTIPVTNHVMTVGELLDVLAELPPDAPLYILEMGEADEGDANFRAVPLTAVMDIGEDGDETILCLASCEMEEAVMEVGTTEAPDADEPASSADPS